MKKDSAKQLPKRIAPKEERSERKRVASSKRIKKMAERSLEQNNRESEQPKNNNKNKKTKKRELELRSKNKNFGQFVRIE